MELTDNEKEFLKQVVKKEIESFKEEGKTIIVDNFPEFTALETKYDEFLNNLLAKLQ